VSRASLGVQTFDPAVQAAIGRVQPYEQVKRAVGWLRETGIEAISFDLMYGLPKQTAESVVETAKRAAALRPRRISAFGYAHVPWMKKHQAAIDTAALPGPEARLVQAETIRKTLLDEGYVPIGFDHFALAEDPLARAVRSGRLRRNFQGFTTDTAAALIGFGASAIGRLPSGYVQNVADIREYSRAVSSGALPVKRGRKLSPEDRARGAIIQQLLCSGVADIEEGVPEDIRRPALARLDPLLRSGLVEYEGGSLRMREEGWPFARLAASAFDAYLAKSPSGHSFAV
jgi:oxygen-independent coproporphyrinogen-3 oxidase